MDRAPALCRWLNHPREAHFADGEASDLGAVTALLAKKTAEGQTFGARLMHPGCMNGELIGFIGFRPHAPHEGQYCGMVIAPEHRGRGHGKRFLALVATVLKEQGYEWTWAQLSPDNHAIRATFAAAARAIETRPS